MITSLAVSLALFSGIFGSGSYTPPQQQTTTPPPQKQTTTSPPQQTQPTTQTWEQKMLARLRTRRP